LLIAFINKTRLTPKQTFRIVQSTGLAMTNWTHVRYWPKADICFYAAHVRFQG
jgi:hypothetical protein